MQRNKIGTFVFANFPLSTVLNELNHKQYRYIIMQLNRRNSFGQDVLIATRHHRGRDLMVVGFMTTYAISAYHH
jgi:hypothetical protein